MTAHRIVIVGTTGTGKSALARRVAEKRGLALIDLDDLYWLPGWKMRDAEDFRRIAGEAARGEKWVMSGNYHAVRDIVWARADTVVWLDYPFHLAFFRLLWRSLRRIRDGEEICNGNRETWGKFLSKDSIMVWLFTSFRRRKKEYGALLANPAARPHISFLRFRTPRETENWLKDLS